MNPDSMLESDPDRWLRLVVYAWNGDIYAPSDDGQGQVTHYEFFVGVRMVPNEPKAPL